ncbi:SRPBCC domain-containing protein [Sphaerisporangium flaviroseum]|uniref:SRPBCC domain-containing protein n=1 Tax=Sphaerisporangium flaviroseum TaxID=509199 RepID=A0ABP7HLA1_9ACTN
MSDIAISRTFDASRETVWKTWTEPERFAAWWGGEGFTTPVDTVSMDVRPGGIWKATMVADDGSAEYPFLGIYTEVTEPEKLVFAFLDAADPEAEAKAKAAEVAADELVVITFTDLGGKTEMVFSQTGTPEDKVEEAEAGWGGFLDALVQHLAKA